MSVSPKTKPAKKKETAPPRQTTTGEPIGGMKAAILRHLTYTLARDTGSASPRDWWIATAMAVRDHILDRLIETQSVHNEQNVRRLYYLSLEYLMGRLLESNLYNAGVFEATQTALQELGVDWHGARAEVDMGLGNGGLGRLAACFLDSLATLDLPAIGYGINYEFGLFRQEFVNGHQVEHPDSWMIFGTPWEIVHPMYTQEVQLYGEVENVFDDLGNSVPLGEYKDACSACRTTFRSRATAPRR
jgi:glycogen phosphorylase